MVKKYLILIGFQGYEDWISPNNKMSMLNFYEFGALYFLCHSTNVRIFTFIYV